ncbi:hypothetical protein MHYP_G00330260 [Metynnis hypsauchen]
MVQHDSMGCAHPCCVCWVNEVERETHGKSLVESIRRLGYRRGLIGAGAAVIPLFLTQLHARKPRLEAAREASHVAGVASLPRPVEGHGKGGVLSNNFHCEQRSPEPGQTSETSDSHCRGNPAPVESAVWEDGMDPHHRLSVTTSNRFFLSSPAPPSTNVLGRPASGVILYAKPTVLYLSPL